MKKIVSLILAVLMIASLTVTAFAADFEVREADDKYTADASTMNTPQTELWLQVDATGQIDVTVPLVLVFKTDIDGGIADTGTNYGITNSSTADLVVTNIAVEEVAFSAEAQPMDLVAYNTENLAEDKYKVQLSVAEDVVKGKFTSGTNSGTYDLYTATHENAAKAGGLFELKKADANATSGKFTAIKADMSTGKLSFVTSRKTDADEMDANKGVKLLTVTYTVAIDTSDAIGSDITTSANNPATGN